MQDAVVVGVLDCPGNDGDDAGGLAGRQEAVDRDALGQCAALDVLHAEVRLPVNGADLLGSRRPHAVEADAVDHPPPIPRRDHVDYHRPIARSG